MQMDQHQLPSWTELDAKLKAGGELTAVEALLYDNEDADHQAALAFRQQVAEALREFAEDPMALKDAARYRWLRNQHWSNSQLCCVSDPKQSLKLGVFCPSGELLDSHIDAQMSQAKPETGKTYPAKISVGGYSHIKELTAAQMGTTEAELDALIQQKAEPA